MSGSLSSSPELLVTSEAKRSFIQKLASRCDHSGQLFEPAASWYNQPPTAPQLNAVVKQLCIWLGIKPRHLSIRYSKEIASDGSYYEDQDGHHLVINQRYENLTYQAIAITAHEFTHYIVKSRWHINLSDSTQQEELVDLASIYLGFGPTILNGLRRHESWLARAWAAALPANTGLQIGSMTAYEYAREVGHMVADSPLAHEDDLYAQLAPWSRRLFTSTLPEHAPKLLHVKQADKRIREANIVFVGSVLAVVAVIGLMAFVAHQLPNITKPEVVLTKKEHANTLYDGYVLCQSNLTARKAAIAHPDIAQSQTFEADQNRCLSLQNQYNSAVDEYNQLIKK